MHSCNIRLKGRALLVAFVGAVAMIVMASPPTVHATAPFELLLDCGNGPGASCTRSSGTTTLDVSVVLKNNSGSASSVGALDFDVVANQAVFTPTSPACAGTALNCNPDANNAVLAAPQWACNAPNPVPDANGSPFVAESVLSCFTSAANGPAIPNGGTLVLATVHYTSVDGVGSFVLANTDVSDNNAVTLTSCVDNCSGVIVTVGAGNTQPPAGTTVTNPGAPHPPITSIENVGSFTLTAHPAPPCTGATVTYTIIVTVANGWGPPAVGTVLRSGPMTETSLNSGIYTAVVPEILPLGSFTAEVTITFTGGVGAGCGPINFPVYIDPSGIVKNQVGPLPGATVTLLKAPAFGGPFTPVANGDTGVMSPANSTNPDLTDGGGQFGWDVVAGFYKVQATRANCYKPGFPAQPIVETAVMTIPPEVTDIVLTLHCTDVGGIAQSPDLSALPAQTSSQSDGHLTEFAIGGAALAAVAALGIGWYARRRRAT